ncbi:MAG: M61 family metallopeptidase [Acidobacteria bacterium]|nr:M61 family metallopeptidase [Acidobacteriota bacterium]
MGPLFRSLIAICAGGIMAAAEVPIQATVRPLDLAQHQIQVTLRLPDEATKKGATLALPAWTPGSYLVRDYARFVDRVEAKDGAGRAVPIAKLDKQRWKLGDGKAITVSYRVYGNDLTVRTNHIDATHAHLVGAATYLYLEKDLARPYEVRFEGFPESWKAATAMPEQGGAYAAKDYDTLVDSPVELGTFHLHRFHAMNADFELAITGAHNGDEARMASDAQKVVAEAGKLFGGFPFDRYVFLLTFSPKAGGGLEHKASTSLLCDPFIFDKPEGYWRLASLMAHEFFHAWNVKRLHDPVLGPFDYSRENYTRQLWFHEGVTSYMEDVLVLHAGVVPWSSVAKSIGAGWTRLSQTPGRHEQSLEESSFDAWIRGYQPTEFSPNSAIDYYGKGQLVGLLMEAELREATGGKAGMPELFSRLWKDRGEKGVTDEDIRKAFQEVSGKDPEPFWNAYVRGRAELDAAPMERAFGLKMAAKAPWEQLSPEDQKDAEAVRRAKSWTGLVFGNGPAPTLQNVIPGSPADAAGLAHPMEILAVDGWRVTNGAEATARFADAGPGHAVEVLASNRGRVLTVKLTVAENPTRTYTLTADPTATEAQRAAFEAWTGQAFPAPERRKGTKGTNAP